MVAIGNLLDRHPNTVRSFYDSYLIHHIISPKRRRLQNIDSSIIDGVIVSAKSYLTQHLSQIEGDFNLSKSSLKTILNDRNIKYFEKTPVTSLTTVH